MATSQLNKKLCRAVELNDIETTATLLEEGADVNASDRHFLFSSNVCV